MDLASVGAVRLSVKTGLEYPRLWIRKYYSRETNYFNLGMDNLRLLSVSVIIYKQFCKNNDDINFIGKTENMA